MVSREAHYAMQSTVMDEIWRATLDTSLKTFITNLVYSIFLTRVSTDAAAVAVGIVILLCARALLFSTYII